MAKSKTSSGVLKLMNGWILYALKLWCISPKTFTYMNFAEQLVFFCKISKQETVSLFVTELLMLISNHECVSLIVIDLLY